MEYLTVKEMAEKWGISGRRVNLLCNEGRIEGAESKLSGKGIIQEIGFSILQYQAAL